MKCYRSNGMYAAASGPLAVKPSPAQAWSSARVHMKADGIAGSRSAMYAPLQVGIKTVCGVASCGLLNAGGEYPCDCTCYGLCQAT